MRSVPQPSWVSPRRGPALAAPLLCSQGVGSGVAVAGPQTVALAGAAVSSSASPCATPPSSAAAPTVGLAAGGHRWSVVLPPGAKQPQAGEDGQVQALVQPRLRRDSSDAASLGQCQLSCSHAAVAVASFCPSTACSVPAPEPPRRVHAHRSAGPARSGSTHKLAAGQPCASPEDALTAPAQTPHSSPLMPKREIALVPCLAHSLQAGLQEGSASASSLQRRLVQLPRSHEGSVWTSKTPHASPLLRCREVMAGASFVPPTQEASISLPQKLSQQSPIRSPRVSCREVQGVQGLAPAQDSSAPVTPQVPLQQPPGDVPQDSPPMTHRVISWQSPISLQRSMKPPPLHIGDATSPAPAGKLSPQSSWRPSSPAPEGSAPRSLQPSAYLSPRQLHRQLQFCSTPALKQVRQASLEASPPCRLGGVFRVARPSSPQGPQQVTSRSPRNSTLVASPRVQAGKASSPPVPASLTSGQHRSSPRSLPSSRGGSTSIAAATVAASPRSVAAHGKVGLVLSPAMPSRPQEPRGSSTVVAAAGTSLVVGAAGSACAGSVKCVIGPPPSRYLSSMDGFSFMNFVDSEGRAETERFLEATSMARIARQSATVEAPPVEEQAFPEPRSAGSSLCTNAHGSSLDLNDANKGVRRRRWSSTERAAHGAATSTTSPPPPPWAADEERADEELSDACRRIQKKLGLLNREKTTDNPQVRIIPL